MNNGNRAEYLIYMNLYESISKSFYYYYLSWHLISEMEWVVMGGALDILLYYR